MEKNDVRGKDKGRSEGWKNKENMRDNSMKRVRVQSEEEGEQQIQELTKKIEVRARRQCQSQTIQ